MCVLTLRLNKLLALSTGYFNRKFLLLVLHCSGYRASCKMSELAELVVLLKQQAETQKQQMLQLMEKQEKLHREEMQLLASQLGAGSVTGAELSLFTLDGSPTCVAFDLLRNLGRINWLDSKLLWVLIQSLMQNSLRFSDQSVCYNIQAVVYTSQSIYPTNGCERAQFGRDY